MPLAASDDPHRSSMLDSRALSAAVAVAAICGVGMAFAGWETGLRLWPALLIPFLFTRFFAVATVATLVGMLVVMGIAQLNTILPPLTLPWEWNYGESLIYDAATRVLHGQPLYLPHDRPPYAHTAYMPLYYWVVAGLRAVFGPGFLPGRLATVAAGLATATLVGYIVERRTRSRAFGLVGALLFFSLGLPWVYHLSGDPFYPGDPGRTLLDGVRGLAHLGAAGAPLPAVKEDWLGVALSVGAIALLVSGTSRQRIALGGLVAALAFLTKQTFVSAGLAGVWWLWQRDRRQALLFGGVGGGTALLTCLIVQSTNPGFVENVLGGNAIPVRLEILAVNLPALLLFQAGPAAVAAMFALSQFRRDEHPADRLLVYFWLASLLPAVGMARAGGAGNHAFLFGASTEILATLGLWQGLRRWPVSRLSALVRVAPLVLTLALLAPIEEASRMRPTLPTAPDRASVRAFNSLVERVRAEPRAVVAARLDVTALADRPMVLEPLVFSALWSEGRWDPEPLIRRICGRQIGLLVFYNPLEYGVGSFHGMDYWPRPVVQAFQETMVFDSIQYGLYTYVPSVPAASTLSTERPRLCPV